MSIADDATGSPRFNQARDKLTKWCEKLKSDFRLRLIAFAEQAEPLDGPESLPALTPTGRATSLSRAMAAAARQFAPNEVAAVVLLSDGIDNSAGNPLDAARKTGMTVHTVGVGASLRDNPSYRDIQVTGIDCPDHMILNNIAKVTGSIDAVGLGGRVIQPVLEEDGRQVAQAELTLDDVEGSQQVAFEFRPTTKGRHTYTVRVEPVEGEKIVENNQRSAVAMVAEAGIRVLYIEGTLRGRVRRPGQSLPGQGSRSGVLRVGPNPAERVSPANEHGQSCSLRRFPKDQETIDKFDVFIFGDIDSSYIRPEQQRMFVKRIRAGAGLVMLGGYHSLGPGGYTGTPLGDALPLKLGGRELGQYTESFLPVLTPDGSHHPIFANIAGFFPTRQGGAKTPGLPPLDGCTRVEAARPGATVLATLPSEGGRNARAGRAAVGSRPHRRCSPPTPRENGSRGRGRSARIRPFLRFWGQMVRWLAGRAETVRNASRHRRQRRQDRLPARRNDPPGGRRSQSRRPRRR